MKRKVFAILLVVLTLLLLSGCGDDKKEVEPEDIEAELTTPETDNTPEIEEPITEEERIEQDMREIISENYKDTDIDTITINQNFGTEDDDSDYIALAYLTWNVKNSRGTTQEMLSMYSEDFAARIGSDIPSVSEFSVFWTVPYHDETQTAMKFTYDRKDDGMYQTDEWNSFAVSSFGR